MDFFLKLGIVLVGGFAFIFLMISILTIPELLYVYAIGWYITEKLYEGYKRLFNHT